MSEPTPSAKTKVGHMFKHLLLTTALLGASGRARRWRPTRGHHHVDGRIGRESPRPDNGSVDLGPQNLDGVGVTLTFGNKGTNPNELNEANILITNTTPRADAADHPWRERLRWSFRCFKLSGAINLDSGGAELVGQYFVDGDQRAERHEHRRHRPGGGHVRHRRAHRQRVVLVQRLRVDVSRPLWHGGSG